MSRANFLICSIMTIVDKYASSWRQEIKSEKDSGLKRFRPSSDWQIEEFKSKCDCKNESDLLTESFCHKVFPTKLCKSSLRKQPTFGDVTTGFPAKWRLRNERRNSILITRHYPDLGSDSESVAKCRGSWVVGRGRGLWVWVWAREWVIVVGKKKSLPKKIKI